MSRYYDYDYDRGCIIGFGSDHDDSSGKLSASSSCKSLSSSAYDSLTSTSNVPLPDHDVVSRLCHVDEIADDADDEDGMQDADDADDNWVCIQQAQPDDFKLHKLKPYIVEVPFVLNADRLKYAKWKQLKVEHGDSVDSARIHRHLATEKTTNTTAPKSALETPSVKISRSLDYNGAYFNLFGTARIAPSQCRIWRLQMLGHSPCIVGVIDSEAPLLNNGAYFGGDVHYIAYAFNSVTAETYCSAYKQQQPHYQRMLQSGRLDKPMIVDLKLDLLRRRMSITNQTPNCQHCGKEILLFDGINASKTYKLAISLLGPETIFLL